MRSFPSTAVCGLFGLAVAACGTSVQSSPAAGGGGSSGMSAAASGTSTAASSSTSMTSSTSASSSTGMIDPSGSKGPICDPYCAMVGGNGAVCIPSSTFGTCGDPCNFGESCKLDSDCPAQSICGHCANGSSRCVSGCSVLCNEGESCGAADHACVPATCAKDTDCPKHFECNPAPDAGTGPGCTRIACKIDGDCGGGYCIQYACYELVGYCQSCI